MSDIELKEYGKVISADYINAVGDKGVTSSLCFFYGFFAFIGTLIWCFDEAMTGKPIIVQTVNYSLLITGAISLFYAYRKDKAMAKNRILLKEEMIEVEKELFKKSHHGAL